MGGKTSQSTSNVSVPENVKAMYTSAADAARTAANRPFQQYSTDPNAFVAGLTGTQQAAIQNTNAAQGSYQPFYNQSVQSLYAGQQAANPLQAQAAQFGLAGAQGVDPSQLGAQQINQYMSPYLNSVVQSTLAPLQQQQQQQQSALVGDQIGAGAFGGDRGRIAQANLAQQQNMATAQIVSGLMNQGYGQALSTAQQQQGVGLGAAQANRAAQQQAAGQMAALGQQGYSQGMGTSQQLANLGTGALQNQLSGAQAQMGMGTAEQQAQQAGLQAMYNQFLQQQGYPFQTAQFLTNQMATLGPLYGTTTTKEVPTDLLGNPKAHGGAIERKSGGLVPSSEGGAVSPAHAGLGFAYGGSYSPEALAEIIQMQKAMFPFAAESGSRVGGGTGPLGIGLVPANPKPLEYAKFDVRDKSEPSFNDKLLALLNENSTTTKAPASYRGGVAGSSHYAAGGSLPYATDTSYVPQQEEQKDSSGLLGADSSSSTRGGGAAADLVRLQTLLSLFSDDSSSKKNGGVAGRQGYATIGGVPNLFDPNAVSEEDTPEEREKREAELISEVRNEELDQQRSKIVDDTRRGAINFALQQEGKDPTPGEGSVYGINPKYNPDVDLAKLTPEGASDIYRERYWNAIGGDKLAAVDPGLAHAVFDTAVMSGPGTAKKLLEQSGGDAGAFMDQREAYLRGLPNYKENPGWENRNKALRAVTVPKNESVVNRGLELTKDRTPENYYKSNVATNEAVDRQVNPRPVPQALLNNNDYYQGISRSSQGSDNPDVSAAPAVAAAPVTGGVAGNNQGSNAGLAGSAAAGLAGSAASKGNQGEEPEKNWFARNKDWMLPLAKGVGATLEGRGGKFLPAALLKGAAAGVLSVPGLQKQAADVAEAQENVKTKQLSNAQTAYNVYIEQLATSPFRNEKPVSFPEFVKKFNLNIPFGTSGSNTPSGGVSVGNHKYDLQEYQNPNATVTYKDGSKVSVSNDPGYLRSFIAKYSMISAPAIKSTVQDAQTRLAAIEEAETTRDVNGRTVFLPGNQEAGSQSNVLKQNLERGNAFRNEALKFQQELPAVTSGINELDTIFQNYQGGRGAAEIAELAGFLKTIDPTGNAVRLLPKDWNQTGAYDEATKVVANQILTSLSDMPGGAPAAEMSQIRNSLADATRDPKARRELIVHMKALLKYKQDVLSSYKLTGPDGLPVDPTDHQMKFNEEHLPKYNEEYLKPAYESTPQYAGMDKPQSKLQPPASENQIAKVGKKTYKSIKGSDGKLTWEEI